MSKVGIIGAGLSGLVAARTLADAGMSVSVFEKSRGTGGRMATRRADQNTAFDHGAQYFTVRDPVFRQHVESWITQGLVAAWPNPRSGQRIVVLKNGLLESESSSVDRFVGVPAMNSICKHLASGLNIRRQVRIEKVVRAAGGTIQLTDDQGHSHAPVDRLVVTAPAEQSAELLVEFAELSTQIAKVVMNPCWATMATFDQPLTDQWVGAFLHDSFLSWTARNNTKPDRNNSVEQLVIHAAPEWTQTHWESGPDEVTEAMLAEFWRVTGIPPRNALAIQGHRWKYAIAEEPLHDRCLCDNDAGIVACGDWASGSRVEGAFLSGLAAADEILRRLPSRTEG